MKFLPLLAAVLALVPATAPAEEDARPRLTWVIAVPPPAHIPDRTGYVDETLDWFIARLPQFRHEVVIANSKRLQDMIASDDGVCGPAMLKTPAREQDTAFSHTVYWSLPNRLIVSAARPAALDAHVDARGEVDLPALLADRTYAGGLQFGRSYGAVIDDALGQAQQHPNESASLVSVRGPGHFDMLAGGRFDWTLAFPIEALWWARRLAVSPDKAEFLGDLGGDNLAYLTRPIAGSTDLIPGYIGCSRRPLGQSVITAVDRLVDAAGPNPPWLDYYLNWLDAGTRADYLKARAAKVR
jgi:uncharacterized protein (TIGR02285 family)